MSFASGKNIQEIAAPQEDIAKAFESAKHFDPVLDRILVKREVSALERKAGKSGIILADTTKEAYKSAEGYLIKCGPNCEEWAEKLIGKRILFAKYSGEDIIIPLPNGDKEEFVLATYLDIFGELK